MLFMRRSGGPTCQLGWSSGEINFSKESPSSTKTWEGGRGYEKWAKSQKEM